MSRIVPWVCAALIAVALLWQLYTRSGFDNTAAPAGKSSATAGAAHRPRHAQGGRTVSQRSLGEKRAAAGNTRDATADTHHPSTVTPPAQTAARDPLKLDSADAAAAHLARETGRPTQDRDVPLAEGRQAVDDSTPSASTDGPATPAAQTEARRPEVLLIAAIGRRNSATSNRRSSAMESRDVAVEFELTGPELGSPRDFASEPAPASLPRTAGRTQTLSPSSQAASPSNTGEAGTAASSSSARNAKVPHVASLPEGFPEIDELTDDADSRGADSATSEAIPPTPSLSESEGESPEADEDDTPSRTAELSPALLALRNDLRRCTSYYYQHPERASERDPWGVMHALIAYGVDTELYAGDRKVNAIGWLCFNGNCRGMRLLYLDNGRVDARQGVGLQGHPGQFLAMLAQSRVPADFPLRVDGREFTVADLIETEKLTCRSGTELTFKLISLAHYLDTEATWKDDRGGQWSIPRLIREELAQPVVEGACGGTHRMMGFSYAVRKRQKSGLPFVGEWERARKFVDDYHRYTLALQNPDGSMSTNWFRGRGDGGDENRRLETTGHMTEWLVYSLPQEELTDPRVVKSVGYLTNLLWQGRDRNWGIGPKGHALHALVIYDQRVFGAEPGQGGPQFVEAPSTAEASATAERR